VRACVCLICVERVCVQRVRDVGVRGRACVNRWRAQTHWALHGVCVRCVRARACVRVRVRCGAARGACCCGATYAPLLIIALNSLLPRLGGGDALDLKY
jgi:hypothetical protein